jgi:hypothetical protein
MRRWIAIAVTAGSVAVSVGLWVAPASAATVYRCTMKSDGHTTVVFVRTDKAEDALEAHGFTCKVP